MRRAPSLSGRLLALVLLLAATLLALGGIFVWQAHDAARSRAADAMLGTTRAMAMLVDREFARAEALLQGLAAHPGIAAGDRGAFLTAVARLGEAAEGAVIVLATPAGHVASNIEGLLDPPRQMGGSTEAVFATGRTTLSDLYPGRMTGNPVISLFVPVRRADGDAPAHAVGMTLNRGRLAESLVREHLPPGAVAAVLDRQDVVVARTRREGAVVGRRATDPVVRGLAQHDAGLIERVSNQDGEVSVIAYARAPASRYAVVMSLPEEAFAAERNAALTRLGTAAAPVALGALLVAFVLGLRLKDSLARLRAGAEGRGPRLAEVEELGRALAAADAARAASEAEARDRNAWLEATQRAAHVGTWDHDLVTGVLRWSDTMWVLYGLDPLRDGPATTTLFRAHVLEEDLPAVDAARRRGVETGIYEAEFRIRRGDGAIRWIRAQGELHRAPDGAPLRMLGANLDITDRRALEAEREALAAQQELLVAEMHHRVKNSLQLVQGLLLTQARGEAPETAAKLRDAAGRIVSIAAVHRRLYEGGANPRQEVAEHLAGLVEDLRRSVGGDRRILLDVAPGLALPPERMVPLGLLATELVTNAMKHGVGTVTLRLVHDVAMAGLTISDEGPGFPGGFDPSASRGLGMRVALAMARQLRGTLRVEQGPGGRVVAAFPLSPLASPNPADPAASR
jgi:PAS domain S-box-containing protein